MNEESKGNNISEHNENDKPSNAKKAVPSDYQKIRSQFDNVLHKHIIRLIEIEAESTLKFDTCTVACLVLLVERDREIKNFPKSPPDRYIRDTFLNDLSDIGLEIDDDLTAAFETLVKLGYVGIDKDENYCALISTLALVKFINNLFSGMPGLNLIAYIIQCIDEILTGRKELKEHLKNFEQTLVARGVSISKQNLKEEEKESIKQTATTFKVSKEAQHAAEKLKKANVQKLASLRTMAVKTDATSKYVSASPSDVKEVFPKKSDIEQQREKGASQTNDAAEQAALELEKKQADLQRRERELREAEETRMALEIKKAEIEAREAEVKKAEFQAREAEIAAKEAALKSAEIAAKEAKMAAREAELKAMEAQLKSQADETEDAMSAKEESHPEKEETPPEPDEEMSIEEKIAAFEAELAMPCPICSIGKIVASITEKGKDYYACTNTSCKFVSWSKPYHFFCPLCKNPYLVEFLGEGGTPGLKCPRAVCSYTQSGLAQPQTTPVQGPGSGPEGGGVTKKKKRIVRRRKR